MFLNKNGVWLLTKDCKKVFWKVKLNPSIENVSLQQSGIIKSKKVLVLFSEFSSLPRLESKKYKSILQLSKDFKIKLLTPLKKYKKNSYILTNANQIPMFLLFDFNPSEYKNTFKNRLNYIIDIEESKKDIELFYPKHKKAIKYIYSLFEYLSYDNFKSNVVWIGTKSKSYIGGAAGYNTFLLNYAINKDKQVVKNRLIYSFMTAIHEQFHTIAPENETMPTWIAESLAQYYAVKILSKLSLDKKEIATIEDKFFNQKIDGIGLIEANSRFISQGDMSQYPLFYTKGSAFWNSLDKLILKTTNKSLDNYIGNLMKMNFPKDYSLPKDFIKLLEINKIDKSDLERVLNKYL